MSKVRGRKAILAALLVLPSGSIKQHDQYRLVWLMVSSCVNIAASQYVLDSVDLEGVTVVVAFPVNLGSELGRLSSRFGRQLTVPDITDPPILMTTSASLKINGLSIGEGEYSLRVVTVGESGIAVKIERVERDTKCVKFFEVGKVQTREDNIENDKVMAVSLSSRPMRLIVTDNTGNIIKQGKEGGGERSPHLAEVWLKVGKRNAVLDLRRDEVIH